MGLALKWTWHEDLRDLEELYSFSNKGLIGDVTFPLKKDWIESNIENGKIVNDFKGNRV